MKYAYTTTDGRRMAYHPKFAGWAYGQSGICKDAAANVHYPWHQAHRGACVRCGEQEPKKGMFVPMDDSAGAPAR